VFTNVFLFIWPYNALHVEVTPDSSRMVGNSYLIRSISGLLVLA